MKLRVIGDGTLANTRVENAETHELIEGITDLKLRISPYEVPYIQITLVVQRGLTNLDLEGELRSIIVKDLNG